MALRSLNPLLENFGAAVWRADQLAGRADAAVLASGHAALDDQLPGGGWPLGALCEILQAPGQHNEWRLLLPVLRKQVRQVVLVAAPHLPFGPGLAAQGLDPGALLWVRAEAPAQRLWAAELALRCAGVAALLLWLPQVRAEQLRRLHLSAQTHGKLLFVLRPASAQTESSPAALRLLLGAPDPEPACPAVGVDALRVQILKRRGPPLAQSLWLAARPAPLSVLLAASQLAAALATAPGPGVGLNLPAVLATDGLTPPARLRVVGLRVERQDALDCFTASA
jgi:protein ImuA